MFASSEAPLDRDRAKSLRFAMPFDGSLHASSRARSWNLVTHQPFCERSRRDTQKVGRFALISTRSLHRVVDALALLRLDAKAEHVERRWRRLDRRVSRHGHETRSFVDEWRGRELKISDLNFFCVGE